MSLTSTDTWLMLPERSGAAAAVALPAARRASA